MFKFIHAADIHLDSPLRGLAQYETAPKEAIRDACRNAFINLVDLAIEEKVAFVLLAGDLYDGDWKDYGTGIFLSQQMGRLGKKDIKVFVVAGNHDAANQMTKALNIPKNMTMLAADKVETVKLDDLNVNIHGQSFKSKHVDENLAAGFPLSENNTFNIGLLHTSLDGREGHAVYAPCTIDDLKSKGYQYWALGHVHEKEIVSQDPWVVFPGCIQGRHIRECGSKGCMLVVVEDNSVAKVEECSLDVFRWMECTVDIEDAIDMREVKDRTQEAIESELESADGRPVAMRIRMVGAASVSSELAAYPERFENELRALAAEIADDELWIERVINVTTDKLDLEAALQGDNPFGSLLNSILSTPESPGEINGLNEVISDLRKKLPHGAFGPDSILNLDEDETIERLVQESKKLLVFRLLKDGGVK